TYSSSLERCCLPPSTEPISRSSGCAPRRSRTSTASSPESWRAPLRTSRPVGIAEPKRLGRTPRFGTSGRSAGQICGQLRELNYRTQSSIYSRGIGERLRQIWLDEDEVRALFPDSVRVTPPLRF